MQRTIVAMCWLFALIFFSSCGHFDRDRKYYMYYKILATNDTLDNMTKEWHQALNRAMKDKYYANLSPYRLRIGKFLNRSRNDIGHIPVSPEAAAIVDNELMFLANQATIVSEVYPRFEPFNEMTPEKVLNNQLKALSNDLENEVAANAAIRRSLKVFVYKNGLKVSK